MALDGREDGCSKRYLKTFIEQEVAYQSFGHLLMALQFVQLDIQQLEFGVSFTSMTGLTKIQED